MATDTAVTAEAAPLRVRPERRWTAGRALRGIRRFCRSKPLGAVGIGIVLALVLLAVLSPALRRYGPEQTFQRVNPDYDPNSFETKALQPSILNSLTGPTAEHWLGTDNFGRDTWSRVVEGSRRSLGIGVGSLALGTLFGVIIGLVSAYFGGFVDTVLQRLIDALLAFPTLLFLLLLVTLQKPSVKMLIFGIAVVATPQITRIVRGAALQTRQMQFVDSAHVIGAGDLRIMVRHILPNILPAVIVVFTLGVGAAILAEAALSFLALAPPGVSWGNGLQIGLAYQRSSPWIAIANGTAISLAVLGFNLAGDALRDVLDPRLRT